MNRFASRLLGMAASVAMVLALAPGSATAQMTEDSRPPVEIDLRGGLYVPTFDIAFSDEAEVGTSNSWDWPFTAGVRITPGG